MLVRAAARLAPRGLVPAGLRPAASGVSVLRFATKGSADSKSKTKTKRPSASDSPAPSGGGGDERLNELYMRCLEPAPRAIAPISEEDRVKGEALAKTYTRAMWKRENELRKDLNHKLNAKMCAIWALPTDELRTEALLVTDPTYRLDMRLPTLTPPMRGWHRDQSQLADPEMVLDTKYARMKREEIETQGYDSDEPTGKKAVAAPAAAVAAKAAAKAAEAPKAKKA